jgi:hypothetical protein
MSKYGRKDNDKRKMELDGENQFSWIRWNS